MNIGSHITAENPFSDLRRRSVDLNKSILETEIPIPPVFLLLAILGIVSFPIVPPTADNFPTGEAHRPFPDVLNMSFALILIAEDVPAHTAAPLPSNGIERGCAVTAPRLRRLSAVLLGVWFLREWGLGRCGEEWRIVPERRR